MVPRVRTGLAAVAAAVAAIGLTGLGGLAARADAASSHHHSDHRRPAVGGTLFDDFDYAGSGDPSVAAHGWQVRTASGGPGVDGATWSADNISFPRVQGHKSLQLRLTTDGTAAGTTESEFSQSTNGREGTYLARIKFSDAPASGPDGDFLNQTFFAIGALASDCDTNYSETDFSEYLPNGGWGTPGPLNSETTWYTPGDTCSDSVENDQAVSLAGWHTIMATIAAGHVRYYVDGQLVADHSGKYYPREDMVIDFNTWLIDTTGHTGTATSVWNEDVDYVYYAQNRALSPRQAEHAVRSLRARHHYLNTITQ